MAPNKPEAKKDAKKVKIPHAIKTHKQSLKRNAINRAFKSKVRTFINHFEAAIKSNSSAEILREKLNDVYSLMDKGVKRGDRKSVV